MFHDCGHQKALCVFISVVINIYECIIIQYEFKHNALLMWSLCIYIFFLNNYFLFKYILHRKSDMYTTQTPTQGKFDTVLFFSCFNLWKVFMLFDWFLMLWQCCCCDIHANIANPKLNWQDLEGQTSGKTDSSGEWAGRNIRWIRTTRLSVDCRQA